MRALAVLAVLAYHGGVVALPGGFLGVEIFLVISGYLITALLLAERAANATVNLRDFWVRRARRLLPAVVLLLVVVSVWSVLFAPDTLANLRGDVVASLLYVQNWHQIFTEQSYFEAAGRPPLLRHLWSLAVEEQFYLVWPLVFAAGMAAFGRRRVLWGVLGGAAASTVLMAVLFSPGVDPTRVYYGTDTRASGLLLGVALAFVAPPWQLQASVGRGGRAVLNTAGAGAVVVLALLVANVGEFSTFLYRGGFGVTGVATVVLIAVVAHPAADVGRVLGVAPLRWIGLRSYGIYLWHWPVFVLTRPDVDVTWPGWVVVAVRLGFTFGLAELSYRYVEVPIRAGALGRSWQRIRTGRTTADTFLRRRVAWGSGVLAVVLLVTGTAMVRAEPPPPPPWFVEPLTQAGSAQGVPGVLSLLPVALSSAIVDTNMAREAAEAATRPWVVGRTTTLGDSVMLGAADQLAATLPGEVYIDAAVSRQVDNGLAVLQLWRDTRYLGETVVVHLGNNGTFTDSQFDDMMEIVDGVPNVVVVNTRSGFTWQQSVNDTLARGAERYDNVTLVDWLGASAPHGNWFWSDRTHLRPEGAEGYASIVNDAVSRQR